MMVDVPIELIDKDCLHCPELKIYDYSSTVEIYNFNKEPAEYSVHTLRCEHVNRCKILLNTRKEHVSE